ncbi:MAG: hypothetical protein HC836_49900 [Richelia sp. RM2_1_2]|nr:hypothetical protein [Richelia sp. RM1_1_1]NJO65906.1 hypothetical protein [Richelia sp. RM2_1_2]
MATQSKAQKILFAIALIAVVCGVNVSHRTRSNLLLLLGFTSGSSYLLISPKPWVIASDRRRKYKEKIFQYRQLRSQYLDLVNRVELSATVEELGEKIALLEKTRNQLFGDCESLEQLAAEMESESVVKAEQKYRDSLAELEIHKQQLNSEVAELKKLAEAITNDTERDARIAAARIKQDAEHQALQIIEATKANLQNTVYEPERISHLQLLAQIDEQRQSAIVELERVLGLQEKTRAAIERMKLSAQEEHTKTKKKIIEQAKQQYLKDVEKFTQVIEELENQIKSLLTQNQMLRMEIESYDEPQYPEGYREHEIYARGIIDYYKSVGIKLDYKLSWKEGDRVVVRLIPREEKVGEKQLRSFHDRLQRKFDLSQLPTITTTAGCIQFDMKLIELQTPVVELVQSYSAISTSSPHVIHPELVSHEEMRTHLERAQQREFVPPKQRFSPFEPLTQTERDWALWLYKTVGIKDQNTIMGAIWRNTRGNGVSQGVGQSYIRAREKLHQIFDEANIPRRSNSNDAE